MNHTLSEWADGRLPEATQGRLLEETRRSDRAGRMRIGELGSLVGMSDEESQRVVAENRLDSYQLRNWVMLLMN